MNDLKTFVSRSAGYVVDRDLERASGVYTEAAPIFLESALILTASRAELRALMETYYRNLQAMGFVRVLLDQLYVIEQTASEGKVFVRYLHEDSIGQTGAPLECRYFCRRDERGSWLVEILEVTNAPDPGLLQDMQLA